MGRTRRASFGREADGNEKNDYCNVKRYVETLKIFTLIFEQAEIANYSDQEYAEYEESLKHYRDLKNVIDTAFDDGKAEGLQEGIEKGLEIGIEKGKAEAIRLTALQLKQAGVAVETIAQATGLTIAEIEQLT